MPREKSIIHRLRNILTALGAKTFKTDRSGEPDLLGVYEGFAFAIEGKQPGKEPTPLQLHRLAEWEAAGAIAFWADDPVDAVKHLEAEMDRRRKSWKRKP